MALFAFGCSMTQIILTQKIVFPLSACSLFALQAKVHVLEEKLLAAKRNEMIAASPLRPGKPREIRIFMDGAFDVMHYGHMNAFRLGRSLGTHLIVGVNSDASIAECKGPPLMNDRERQAMVEGCKFVDEVVPNFPYVMTPEVLDDVFRTHRVDYVVHGDDPCLVDGKDVYADAKRRGRYRSIPRTEGVSTTDIVGRMLMMTKDHHLRTRKDSEALDDGEVRDGDGDDEVSVLTSTICENGGEIGVLGSQSKFLTTSTMLGLFSAGVKPPEEGMRVVYVDGSWDMFHCGHVNFLKKISKVRELCHIPSSATCSAYSQHPVAHLCLERRLPHRWHSWRFCCKPNER